MTQLRVVPVIHTPVQRLAEAILPKFQVPVYHPRPGDLALWGPGCRIAQCLGHDTWGELQICARHRNRLKWLQQKARTGRINPFTTDEFISSEELHGGPFETNLHPGFDFRGLPQPLADELRYFVQRRWMDERTRIRSVDFNRIKKQAMSSGLTSLFDGTLHSPDRITYTDSPLPAGFERHPQNIKAHVRWGLAELSEVYWPRTIRERNRWYASDFGLETYRTSTVSFASFKVPWYQAMVKRHMDYRLKTGTVKWSYATSGVPKLRYFDDWLVETKLADTLGGAQDLRRQHLLDFIGWVNKQTGIAASQKKGVVSQLNVMLEDHRLNEWPPDLDPRVLIRRNEFPKKPKLLPRPIDDFVMAQLFGQANFDRLPLHLRAILTIAREHGLRIGSILTLPYDPLGVDTDGHPTLRYWNTKRSRERLHPVRNPAVVEWIRAQQAAVKHRFPDGSPWLFPSSLANLAGKRVTTYSAVEVTFRDWLAACEIRERTGEPAKVTLHQFRHTFATSELNSGAPADLVSELLDHEYGSTLSTYAVLTMRTKREEFFKTARYNGAGERLASLDPTSALSDVAWMKERKNRASVTLPNGYCGLPLIKKCEHQNACVFCPSFLTGGEFLPVHRDQLERTRQKIEEAREQGWQRVVEATTPVLERLEHLVTSLEADEVCLQAEEGSGHAQTDEG